LACKFGASYEIVFLKLNCSDSCMTVGCVLDTPTDWCIRRTVARLAFGKDLFI